MFKPRQVVRDDQGNHFAIDKVDDEAIVLHSVVTKETWRVPLDEASGLVLVEGLVEG